MLTDRSGIQQVCKGVAPGQASVRKSSQDAHTTSARPRAVGIRVGNAQSLMDSAAEAHAVREGDQVVAQDGPLGQIDRIVRSDADSSVYLVVSVGRRVRRRYPILDGTLVKGVDRPRGLVYVRGRRQALERLSESPLLII
jgi:hypothetical protein